MDATIKNALGTITLSEDLIATIVGAAASENYGIVGMNSNSVGDAWFQLIGSENLKRGVKVTVNEDSSVNIELHVTLMYGVSFPAVVQNAISNVKYCVEGLTGLKVNYVDIHVEAVRV